VREETSDLVAAAAAGDSAAWDALVSQYSGLLWSIARGFRLSSADAGDAVQTTWLRLVENLDRIEDPARLPGWLATTVRRECIRLLKRGGRERLSADDDLPDLPDPADPLDTHLLTEERDAALWLAFGRLPERCRVLLRALMVSPPSSYAEISAALGLPIGGIGPTRGRGLDPLRQIAAADDLLSDLATPGGGEA